MTVLCLQIIRFPEATFQACKNADAVLFSAVGDPKFDNDPTANEQEALNRALLEKQADREREIDHLQAQLDKLRRMNFGSHSE